MTDSAALREVITLSGYKLAFLAKAAGITRQALTQKIGNEREFKASEIAALSSVLSLSAKQRDSIFFSKNVN